jgi:hypothetical protein
VIDLITGLEHAHAATTLMHHLAAWQVAV